MLIKNEKPLCAISYDTKTFTMLTRLVNKDDKSLVIKRIEPKEFIKEHSNEYQYINLVIKDVDERKLISSVLDANNCDRFSYINTNLSVHEFTKFGPGCFVYPGVMTYEATIGKDNILHGRVSLAEDVVIGNGCFFSGVVSIAGSTTIGDYCFISTSVTVMDNLKIANDVRLLPGMVIKKSIQEPGTYYNPSVFEIKKLK